MNRGTMNRLLILLFAIFAFAFSSRAAETVVDLQSRDAKVTGNARYVASTDDVGYWGDTNVVMSWIAKIEKAGTYRVKITIACNAASAGSAFDVRIGSQKANGLTVDTGGWEKYKEYDLGPVILRRPGLIPVEVQATRKVGNTMNVRCVRLVREDG